MKVIEDGPGLWSDQAIDWIRAMEDVQLEIIDANRSESFEHAEKFAKIGDLNEGLAAKVKNMEASEPIQDSPSREFTATQQDIEVLEEELQIEKHRSAKYERQLDTCKLELETMEQSDIAQFRLEKVMLLHQVRNLSLQQSSLELGLKVVEPVIQ